MTTTRHKTDEVRYGEIECQQEWANRLQTHLARANYYSDDRDKYRIVLLGVLAAPGTIERECLTGVHRGLDTQSGALDKSPKRSSSGETSSRGEFNEIQSTASEARFHDESVSIPVRLNTLQVLLDRGADVSFYLAEELAKDNLDDDWRNTLVFLAEDVHFPADLRHQVGERLFAIAFELRRSTKVGADKVVWSALRRAVSLLPPDPERFQIFLNRSGPVDTRSVALSCLERTFETAPPADPSELKPVADRVAEFAFKFLDPDIFASGENAVICQNAVCALAALGDPQLGEALEQVKALERPWMNRQIEARLTQLLSSWRMRKSADASHPAVKNLEEWIPFLR